MFFQRDVAKFLQSLTFFLQNATSKTLHFLCFLRKKAKRSNVFLQFHKKYPSENRSESYNSSSGDKNAKNAP